MQLLAALVAGLTTAGVFVARGPPPRMSLLPAAAAGDLEQARRAFRWGADANDPAFVLQTTVRVPLMERLTDWRSHKIWEEEIWLHIYPLQMAVELGDAAMVRLLLAGGADPNGPAGALPTPLQSAIAGNHKEVAELLRQYGARE